MNWRLRIQLNTVAYAVALLLFICAIGFAGVGGYLTLTRVVTPTVAALLTAAGYILVALIAIGAVKAIIRYSDRRRKSRRKHPADELEQALQDNFDPLIGDWIKRNPGRAVLVTLLAGVAAGYSDSVRGALKDLYKRYFGSASGH